MAILRDLKVVVDLQGLEINSSADVIEGHSRTEFSAKPANNLKSSPPFFPRFDYTSVFVNNVGSEKILQYKSLRREGSVSSFGSCKRSSAILSTGPHTEGRGMT